MVILELIHAKKLRLLREGAYLLEYKPMGASSSRGNSVISMTHDNFSNRTALRWRCFFQISALSTVDGTVVAYHGCNG